MKDVVYQCNAFEKTDGDERRTGVGERNLMDFQPMFRNFLRRFKSVAKTDDIFLNVKGFKWPDPKRNDYTFLDQPPYKPVEIAMCFLNSIYQVGPEVAQLLVGREKPPQHLMIITDRSISPEQDETVRGIKAIARFGHQKDSIDTPTDINPDRFIHCMDIGSIYRDETLDSMREILFN